MLSGVRGVCGVRGGIKGCGGRREGGGEDISVCTCTCTGMAVFIFGRRG